MEVRQDLAEDGLETRSEVASWLATSTNVPFFLFIVIPPGGAKGLRTAQVVRDAYLEVVNGIGVFIGDAADGGENVFVRLYVSII